MMMGYMVVLVVHIRFYHCNLMIININVIDKLLAIIIIYTE